jgi:hypothetical protein
MVLLGIVLFEMVVVMEKVELTGMLSSSIRHKSS